MGVAPRVPGGGGKATRFVYNSYWRYGQANEVLYCDTKFAEAIQSTSYQACTIKKKGQIIVTKTAIDNNSQAPVYLNSTVIIAANAVTKTTDPIDVQPGDVVKMTRVSSTSSSNLVVAFIG